jgi:hypothetical protein
MRDVMIGQVAALMGGKLSENEKRELALGLSEDPDAMDLLAQIGLPIFSHLPDHDLPFEVTGQFRAGIEGGNLRLLRMTGLRFGREASRVAACITQIAGEQIPMCFRKAVDLDLDGGTFGAGFVISADRTRNSWSLQVLSDSIASSKDSIEVWQDGILREKTTLSRLAKHRISGVKPGCSLALRPAEEPEGIEIQVSSMEFGPREWVAVCLGCAVEGWIEESISILRNRISQGLEDLRGADRLASFFDILRSIGKSESFVLMPAQATRAVNREEQEARLGVFGSVWRGIVDTWPQTRLFQSAWNPSGSDFAGSPGLPEEVRSLLVANTDAVDSLPDPLRLYSSSPSPDVQAGWAAMRGLTYLILGEYEKARDAFLSVGPSATDPFLLRLAARIAEHFVFVRNERMLEESKRASTSMVWRSGFEEILKSLS